MDGFSSTGIILRRIPYGDADVILTVFTRDKGKISVIAKNAQKSRRRFAGILDLLSFLRIVCKGCKTPLPVLQEASFSHRLSGIRGDCVRTAYACYWAELIAGWLEEGHPQADLFDLFASVIMELDAAESSADDLSILFQSQLLRISGLSPDLSACIGCKIREPHLTGLHRTVDLSGGLICDPCAAGRPLHRRSSPLFRMSTGMLRQIQWLTHADMAMSRRLRFSRRSVTEGRDFLEAFVPFQLGKEPESLKFLKHVRDAFRTETSGVSTVGG